MADDPKRGADPQTKADRIAALEAELAALRGSESGGAGGPERSDEPLDLGRKGGAKAIIVAVVVLGVGLTLIFGLFSTLAKGFDAFADKAAKRLTPGYEDEQPQSVAAKPLRGAQSLKLKKGVKATPTSAPTSTPSSAPATATAPAQAPSPASQPAPEAPKAPAKKPILLPGL